METKSKFGGGGGSEGFYGEIRSKVGPSCSMIKKLTNISVSGFFWIKSKCSKIA